LGVRPGIDVPAAKPADMVQPGEGGLSVSPDDPTNLSSPLNLAHGFIEPARPMTLGDFQDAIERTHDLWKKVDAWPIQGSSTDGN
jgi:hypothetical protein